MPVFTVLKRRWGRAHVRLVGSLSAALKRLRIFAKKQRGNDLTGDERFDADAFGTERVVWSAKQTKIKVKALRGNFLNSL